MLPIMMMHSAHLPLDYKLTHRESQDWVDGVCQHCGTETVHVHEEVLKDEQRWRHIQYLLFACEAQPNLTCAKD